MIVMGRYQFSPAPLITTLYLAIGSSMIGLGLWQLSRADEKIALQAFADQALQATPVAVHELPEQSDTRGFIRVSLRGSFESERQFLWDNRIANGRAGFEVITPFRLADAERKLVLVNRGWIAPGASRAQLPDVSFKAAAESRVVGLLTRPSIGFSRGDAVNLESDEWPRLLQHFDYEQIASVLAEPIVAGVVQSIDMVEPGLVLYKDNWQAVASGPSRHYGYAFQWFAMFAALSGLYFYLNTRPLTKSSTA